MAPRLEDCERLTAIVFLLPAFLSPFFCASSAAVSGWMHIFVESLARGAFFMYLALDRLYQPAIFRYPESHLNVLLDLLNSKPGFGPY